MSMFMRALFKGIINDSTLVLVAMDIALVWGVMGILSFTQGEFLMIAMFCSFCLNLYFGFDPIVPLPICMIIMFGIGSIAYKLTIARALRGLAFSQRLITFALSMVLANLALPLFSGDFKTIPEVAINGSIDLGFMVLSKQKIVPFVVSVCVTGFMSLFLNKTRTGKAICATSMNKTAAGLVGINPEKTYALVLGLPAAIAGAVGRAPTYFYYIYPNVGTNFQLFGFVVVIMGGFGSIPSTFFGGLIMGLADSFTGAYMNTAFKYVGTCVMFLLLVQFKPKGLFGGK